MSIIRTVTAVILGLLIGSVVNMGLITTGPSLIPAPEGVDVTDPESIASAMHLFKPKHFLFPFLGHAAGTAVGAFAGHLIAGQHRNVVAMVIGAAFFAGGVAMVAMVPAPLWFTVTDLVLAYLPMALLGAFLARKARPA